MDLFMLVNFETIAYKSSEVIIDGCGIIVSTFAVLLAACMYFVMILYCPSYALCNDCIIDILSYVHHVIVVSSWPSLKLLLKSCVTIIST